MFEDNEPRPIRGQALRDLMREDLDLQSVEELGERVELLKAEIDRCEAAMKICLKQKPVRMVARCAAMSDAMPCLNAIGRGGIGFTKA